PRTSNEHQILSREIQGWLDPTDDPFMMGRFAGYEIVGIIGHGGMGIVLKGLERSLNRYVAIKILAPRLATNATARLRFAREARAAAAVLHENVVAIHRVAEAHGLPFLVMPYFVGESLQQRIDRAGPLSLQSSLRIGVQIAHGLAAAHAQGLVHRDIKPANIMLEPGVERVQITDFGLARAVDDAALTMTGIIAGTPQYMSPEQASGAAVDARSDIFSLGCLLFACLTGSSPYRAKTSGETLLKLRQGRQTSLREVEPSLPAWVADLLAGFLRTTPANRFQTASQVAAILEQCVLHVQSPNNQLPKTLSKSRWLTGWIVVALVGAATGLILLSFITSAGTPMPTPSANQS
ncbi:MAG: serine/threonine protein kinase, partial [Planctomycetales bacterium]|nr:serine/threonine protein kinase [Planctomycetales bacterium]